MSSEFEVTSQAMEFGPVHEQSGPGTRWTTINASEQMPGVLTPLAFTYWIRAIDPAVRGTFFKLGVLSEDEVRLGDTPDERIGGAFYGRWVANLDHFRLLADLTPGVDGAKFESDVFGSSDPRQQASTRLGRLPVILTKAPLAVIRLPGEVTSSAANIRAWWRSFTAEEQPRPAAERMREAIKVTANAATLQMFAATVGQEMFTKIGNLTARVGHPELHSILCSGYGETEETRLISALYDIAHRGGTIEAFLDQHGARCPTECDIAVRSYRENPDAVRKLVERYRSADIRTDPAAQVAERARGRIAAERQLLKAMPPRQRISARLLLRLAKVYIPLREEGKLVMVTAIDGGRCAARARGRELVAEGKLRDPEDVFYLTLDEILDEPPSNAQALADRRRAEGDAYHQVTVPTCWTGNPPAVPLEPANLERTDTITGIAASNGTAQGTARVITDPDRCHEIEAGEILVCRVTDPSWASAFYLASAVVIDIGGLSSHGAIVCREFNLPCVINTGDGTRQIQTGDRLRVDGATGTVSILSRA